MKFPTSIFKMPQFRIIIDYYISFTDFPVTLDTDYRYMPKYMYPYETYPDYLSGEGYLMSIDTVPILYKSALNSAIVYLEDIFITGTVK